MTPDPEGDAHGCVWFFDRARTASRKIPATAKPLVCRVEEGPILLVTFLWGRTKKSDSHAQRAKALLLCTPRKKHPHPPPAPSPVEREKETLKTPCSAPRPSRSARRRSSSREPVVRMRSSSPRGTGEGNAQDTFAPRPGLRATREGVHRRVNQWSACAPLHPVEREKETQCASTRVWGASMERVVPAGQRPGRGRRAIVRACDRGAPARYRHPLPRVFACPAPVPLPTRRSPGASS